MFLKCGLSGLKRRIAMRVFSAALVFGILFIRTAEASLIGCPSNPATLEEGFLISDQCWSNVHASVSGDFIFHKQLRTCRISSGLGISHPEMSWSLAVCDLGWNIRERFSLHLLAGPAAAVQFQWNRWGLSWAASSDRGMFWGGSSKLIVLEVKDTTLGVDFHGGGIEWMQGTISINKNATPVKFFSRLYFWQLAGGLSQNAGMFRPYAGAAVNQLVSIIRSPVFKKLRFHDLIQVGMYEGCTFTFGPRIFLNIEARQFFESGLAVSGEIRF
jgi:hypothetical protein